MKINELTSRNIIFTQELMDWNLNQHLIMAENRNYIIDTGLGSESVLPILKYLQNKKNTKPIIVINTHKDWDHVWGNHLFKEDLIISHVKTREILNERWQIEFDANQAYVNGEAEKWLPNLTFEDKLNFEDDGIGLFYTPGHTIDGISIYDSHDKVLNVGDNIEIVDDEVIPSLECDKEVYANSLRLYQQYDFKYCISGHSDIGNKECIELALKAIAK